MRAGEVFTIVATYEAVEQNVTAKPIVGHGRCFTVENSANGKHHANLGGAESRRGAWERSKLTREGLGLIRHSLHQRGCHTLDGAYGSSRPSYLGFRVDSGT